jgi:hypothetical protein
MGKRRGKITYQHSTMIEGVERFLKRLENSSDNIKRITFGMIRRTASNQPSLKIKIMNEVVVGGYRLTANKGKSIQDIFVITNLQSSDLQDILNDIAKSS